MSAYYNEVDPFAAAWLRELIKAGQIADGVVDERDIRDVEPSELSGYTQCHFFAGIGVWSYALRLAGWPDSRPVWTGSAPCQPYSAAGKQLGHADERHLWPSFFHLVEQRRPSVLFGEQVEAAIRHGWLDLVQDDLEGINYSFGAVCFPAASVGAPHIRQRLYFVADADTERRREARLPEPEIRFGGSEPVGQLADTENQRRESKSDEQCSSLLASSARPTESEQRLGELRAGLRRDRYTRTASDNSFWGDSDWIYCRDNKYRPVEPGTFPLAHGATNRVGRLRGYGNAIVAPQAAEFIKAFMEVTS